jgi:hypothetical protein
MRPLVAQCCLGLAKLYHRTDRREQGQAHPYREDDVPRDGHDLLEKAEADMREMG